MGRGACADRLSRRLITPGRLLIVPCPGRNSTQRGPLCVVLPPWLPRPHYVAKIDPAKYWSGRRESNPRHKLGRLLLYH